MTTMRSRSMLVLVSVVTVLCALAARVMGETVVSEQDFRNKVRFHSPVDIKGEFKIDGTEVTASASDLNQAAGGAYAGDVTADDINANGSATDTLGINMPTTAKTSTVTVVIYNAADNREHVFKVQGTNDVGNVVRWFQQKVIVADNTQATEDSQIQWTMMVGGATTTVATVNASGVTFAGTVAGTTFSGSGASLTGITTSSLTSTYFDGSVAFTNYSGTKLYFKFRNGLMVSTNAAP